MSPAPGPNTSVRCLLVIAPPHKPCRFWLPNQRLSFLSDSRSHHSQETQLSSQGGAFHSDARASQQLTTSSRVRDRVVLLMPLWLVSQGPCCAVANTRVHLGQGTRAAVCLGSLAVLSSEARRCCGDIAVVGPRSCGAHQGPWSSLGLMSAAALCWSTAVGPDFRVLCVLYE